MNYRTVNFCLLIIISLAAGQFASAQINIGGMTISIPKRPNKPKTDQPANPKKDDSIRPVSTSDQDAAVSDEVEFNKKAPADYDPHLNTGDQAIAVSYQGVERVKILAKSGGVYKAIDLDDSRIIRLFKANSLYPYFDKAAFNALMFEYGDDVKPYLQCYAQKHNLVLIDVTGDSYNLPKNEFGGKAQRASKELQADEPKLAELEAGLKEKVRAYPDTFSEYLTNPAIVNEIVSNRADYMKCVVDSIADEPSPVLPFFLEDIQKAKREVERYTPGKNIYLVSAGAASEELLRAVSPKAREQWSAKWLKNSPLRAQFSTAWDDLAASAKDKIPLYKPLITGFQFHYPAGEKLLMDSFKNTSTLKIFRIGTDTAGWDIQKDNAGLLPTYRYKDVRVYLRDTSDDHLYCKVVTARIKQDYSGGGTYNSTVYRSSVEEEIYGCP